MLIKINIGDETKNSTIAAALKHLAGKFDSGRVKDGEDVLDDHGNIIGVMTFGENEDEIDE